MHYEIVPQSGIKLIMIYDLEIITSRGGIFKFFCPLNIHQTIHIYLKNTIRIATSITITVDKATDTEIRAAFVSERNRHYFSNWIDININVILAAATAAMTRTSTREHDFMFIIFAPPCWFSFLYGGGIRKQQNDS